MFLYISLYFKRVAPVWGKDLSQCHHWNKLGVYLLDCIWFQTKSFLKFSFKKSISAHFFLLEPFEQLLKRSYRIITAKFDQNQAGTLGNVLEAILVDDTH